MQSYFWTSTFSKRSLERLGLSSASFMNKRFLGLPSGAQLDLCAEWVPENLPPHIYPVSRRESPDCAPFLLTRLVSWAASTWRKVRINVFSLLNDLLVLPVALQAKPGSPGQGRQGGTFGWGRARGCSSVLSSLGAHNSMLLGPPPPPARSPHSLSPE